MNVTAKELAMVLATVQGSTMATAFATTVPGMRKQSRDGQTPNPFWSRDRGWLIRKHATVRIAVVGVKDQREGTPYERSVRRERDRRVDGAVRQFHSGHMKWGRIVLTRDFRRLPLKYHFPNSRDRSCIQLADALESPGRLYLDVRRGGVLNCRFETLDGDIVSQADVDPWLFRDSATEDAELQRTGRFVHWRNYRLDHVERVKMFGDTYVVTAAPEPPVDDPRHISHAMDTVFARVNATRQRNGLQPIGRKRQSRRDQIAALVGTDQKRGREHVQRCLDFEGRS